MCVSALSSNWETFFGDVFSAGAERNASRGGSSHLKQLWGYAIFSTQLEVHDLCCPQAPDRRMYVRENLFTQEGDRKYHRPETAKTENKEGCARIGVHWNGLGSFGMDWGQLEWIGVQWNGLRSKALIPKTFLGTVFLRFHQKR